MNLIKKLLHDISNTFTKKQDNTESNGKDDQIVETIPITDTPFTAIKYNEEWFLTIGKYRLTQGMKKASDVIKDAKRADWYRVMQIMQIVVDENKVKSNGTN